jgi:hypothetical protein
MDSKKSDILEALLVLEEAKLKAQLKAVSKLSRPKQEGKEIKDKSMYQVDMAYNILVKEDKPLHINEIISKVKSTYKVELDRETIVSSISKKVNRHDRFARTDKNTFTYIHKEK